MPATGDAGGGSLLLVHGLGEHARRYDHVAAAITGLGLEVRGYDQRGFGRSGGPRGSLPHPDALLDDLAFMFGRLGEERRRQGDFAPPFVLGHSLGGCLVARAVTGGWIAPRGMLLSSPALSPRMTRLQYLAAVVGNRLFPNIRVPSRLPVLMLTHDTETLDRMFADEEMHNRVTPRLIAFLMSAGRAAIVDAPACTAPALLLVAGDDHLCDPDASRRFHARLRPGLGTLHVYDALYHEIFNERPPEREIVLRDLANWLAEQPGIGERVRPAIS